MCAVKHEPRSRRRLWIVWLQLLLIWLVAPQYYKYISLWNMEHDTTAAATAAAVRDVGHISP